MKTEILDEWARHNSFTELMIMRARFQHEHEGLIECTCDQCAAMTICSLAFDPYNSNGDCLYDK